MATAHLLHGYLGAGKTTFTRQLETELPAVRISSDEWHLRLFTDGSPETVLDPVHAARLDALLLDHWPRLLELGLDVVLDFGFWSRSARNRAGVAARRIGANVRLYWVRCDNVTARARVLARNEKLENDWHLDSGAFEQLRHKYEPLGEDEPHVVIDST